MSTEDRIALARRLLGYAQNWAINGAHFPPGHIRSAMLQRSADCRAAGLLLAPGLAEAEIAPPPGPPVEAAVDIGDQDEAAARAPLIRPPPVPESGLPTPALQAAVAAAEVVLAQRPHDDAQPLAEAAGAIREVLADREAHGGAAP